MVINLFFLFILFAGFLSPPETVASDPGVVIRACQIMSEPFRDASSIASLKEGEMVEIMKRKGGWFQVSAKGKSGWVRMLYVRRGTPGEQASAATEATGMLGMATGRAGSGNVVAATGVRGLDEEELKEADFNEKELQTLKAYGTTKKEAQEFASQAGLKAQHIPFLKPTDGN